VFRGQLYAAPTESGQPAEPGGRASQQLSRAKISWKLL
jgi:hypothetical protein